jgi:hypothetical protein
VRAYDVDPRPSPRRGSAKKTSVRVASRQSRGIKLIVVCFLNCFVLLISLTGQRASVVGSLCFRVFASHLRRQARDTPSHQAPHKSLVTVRPAVNLQAPWPLCLCVARLRPTCNATQTLPDNRRVIVSLSRKFSVNYGWNLRGRRRRWHDAGFSGFHKLTNPSIDSPTLASYKFFIYTLKLSNRSAAAHSESLHAPGLCMRMAISFSGETFDSVISEAEVKSPFDSLTPIRYRSALEFFGFLPPFKS